MISRRRVLGTVSAVVSYGIAGCTEESGSGTFAAFESQLSETSLETTAVSHDSDDKTATVEYIPRNAGSEDALADEIGTIMGVFFDQIDAGWDVSRLDGILLTENQEPAADWYAEAEWYEQLQAGELTPDELSIQVLNTVSPVDS